MLQCLTRWVSKPLFPLSEECCSFKFLTFKCPFWSFLRVPDLLTKVDARRERMKALTSVSGNSWKETHDCPCSRRNGTALASSFSWLCPFGFTASVSLAEPGEQLGTGPVGQWHIQAHCLRLGSLEGGRWKVCFRNSHTCLTLASWHCSAVHAFLITESVRS